jgi:hypothetical protein
LQRSISVLYHIDLSLYARIFGTNRFGRRSEPMAQANKTSKGIIPEPSFEFFLRAIGVMLLLVVIMAAYFSVRT